MAAIVYQYGCFILQTGVLGLATIALPPAIYTQQTIDTWDAKAGWVFIPLPQPAYDHADGLYAVWPPGLLPS